MRAQNGGIRSAEGLFSHFPWLLGSQTVPRIFVFPANAEPSADLETDEKYSAVGGKREITSKIVLPFHTGRWRKPSNPGEIGAKTTDRCGILQIGHRIHHSVPWHDHPRSKKV